jgi:hypothetical protein
MANLGSRVGDIDGDGKPETVTLTIEDYNEPITSERLQPAVGRLLLRARLANDELFDQTVNLEADVEAAWSGIADINGDGRDEIVPYFGDRLLLILEYRDGVLAPLRGLDDGYISINNMPGSKTGLICDMKDGKARLLRYSFGSAEDTSPPSYLVTETIYEADADGMLKDVHSHKAHMSEKAAFDLTGLHCPGLDSMGRR